MNQEDRDRLHKNCIEALEAARESLNECIHEMSGDLIKMKKREDEMRGYCKHVDNNQQRLRPDIKPNYHNNYDASQNLTTPIDAVVENINSGLKNIAEFFNLLGQYEEMINREFPEFADNKKARLDNL